MTVRTNRKVVTFNRPFALTGFDETLPAGTYTLETDEEPLEGISFLAYRRRSTRLYQGGKPGSRVLDRVFTIDPEDLDAALMLDREPVEIRSEPDLDDMLADPMVHLVMCSDGLSEYDVRRTLLRRFKTIVPSVGVVA